MSIPEALPIVRQFNVIYADDLRQEIDGKVTVVGMYQQQMLFPQFPAMIPKLAIWMTAITPREQMWEKLIFQVYCDEILLFEAIIPSADLILPTISSTNLGDQNIVEVQCATIQSAMTLEGPCILRPRLITEDGAYAGRSLRVLDAGSLDKNLH
jgi:hypothetical protein